MLKEQLNKDLKDAMRARDRVRLRTIRSLRAAMLDQEISERKDGQAELSEETMMAVIQKQAKQRRDALEQYEKAGREDLAEIEREELAVLKDYLPEQLSEEDVRREVQAVVAEVKAESMKDMGRVMGPVMQRLKGKADGRMVQSVVRQELDNTR